MNYDENTFDEDGKIRYHAEIIISQLNTYWWNKINRGCCGINPIGYKVDDERGENPLPEKFKMLCRINAVEIEEKKKVYSDSIKRWECDSINYVFIDNSWFETHEFIKYI